LVAKEKGDSSPIISQSLPLSHKPNVTLPLAPEKSIGSAGSSANSMHINNNILSSEDSSSSSFTTKTSTTFQKSHWEDKLEPLVDKGTRTIEELILEAAGTLRTIPHPPYILGGLKDGPKFYKNLTCARFPTIYYL